MANFSREIQQPMLESSDSKTKDFESCQRFLDWSIATAAEFMASTSASTSAWTENFSCDPGPKAENLYRLFSPFENSNENSLNYLSDPALSRQERPKHVKSESKVHALKKKEKKEVYYNNNT